MPVLKIDFIAKDDDGSERKIGWTWFNTIKPDQDISDLSIAVAEGIERDFPKQCQTRIGPISGWKKTEPREGQIALAVLGSIVEREGLPSDPEKFRSALGNRIKDLNEKNPDLKLEFNEAVRFARKFYEPRFEAMMKLKSDENSPNK